MSKKIGFVGLGTMGFPMAVNLKKAGFEVIGYDAFKGTYEKAGPAGITMVQTLKEVAEQADEAIISMVRDYPQNVEIIFGENGLLSPHTKGKTIIVMSTLDPDLMGELAKKVEAESDLKLISAAVSGGLGRSGRHLVDHDVGRRGYCETLQAILRRDGVQYVYYSANPGNSQVAKLVNNMILGITMSGVAEGLKLGEHYKLPEQEILNLLKISTGDSWVVRNWSDVKNCTAEIALAVLLKDLKSAFLEVIKHNVTLPFNSLSATQLFNSMGKHNPKVK